MSTGAFPGQIDTNGISPSAAFAAGEIDLAAAPDVTGPVPQAQASEPAGLVIIADYDSSITDLSQPLYAEVTGAITAAIDFYEAAITTPITVTIDFGYGEIAGAPLDGGALSESTSLGAFVPYDGLQAALNAHITPAGASPVPTVDPSGNASWLVSYAELSALGYNPSFTIAGFVGLSSSAAFTYDPNNRAVGGEYDAIGALEHEISEVLGRVSHYNGDGSFTPLDLFRYTSAGSLATDVGAAYFSTDGGQTSLAGFDDNTANGGDPGDWSSDVPSDSYDAFASPGVANTVSSTDLIAMQMLGYSLADVPCFLAGTRIATPSGEEQVERLSVGDKVLTARGIARPIVWIGTGHALATGGQRNAATPVIVRRDALADTMPARDLRVTKGHSLLLDGVLIPVEELINQRSILWDDRAQEVTVYHIELETHDILLAEGAPAESYRDDGNRWLFRNANTGWDLPPQPPCAPVITSGPVVDDLWRRLHDRAGPRSGLPLTSDPDLHLLVDGSRLGAAERRGDAYRFELPDVPAEVRVVSRSSIPQAIGTVRDPRRLGVALVAVTLRQGRTSRLMEASDARLTQGFHAFEAVNGLRWTDGDAVLPCGLFEGFVGPATLVVRVGCISQYVEDCNESDAA